MTDLVALRATMDARYATYRDGDEEEEDLLCEHDSGNCLNCGSRSDCGEYHGQQCPHGCPDCQYNHHCSDCGNDPECIHDYRCRECEEPMSP